MSSYRILLADNNRLFLDTRAEFLQNEGFEVLKAHTVEEARHVLQNELIHLAILDIKMENDDDPRDISGLLLAQEEAYRSVAKIMLTGFPSYEYVRDALGGALKGRPSAIAFLAKKEGAGALLQAVREAFAGSVQVNWNVVIQHNKHDPITFFHLVKLFEEGLENKLLPARAEELDDLFRRLFHDVEQIRIDRLLWQREGGVALAVFAFATERKPESLVVTCGVKTNVAEETRRYQAFAPKAPSQHATVRTASTETIHFAANVYSLAGTDLENTHSLIELYRTGPEKSFNAVLSNLYQQTLADWSHEKNILEERRTLDELYRMRLGLTAEREGQVADRMQALIRQMPTLGLKIERGPGSFTLRLGGVPFSFPDPAPIIYRKFPIGQPVLLSNTPGMLSGENILTDETNRAWLTDFAGAGLAPVLWNFVTLEAAIRFDWVALDWVETYKVQWLHELEQALVEGHFSRLESSEVEAPIRKPLRAIRMIRQLAAEAVGQDTLPYHFGMLFHAASRLAEFNPAAPHTSKELARPAHAMIAAAMICRKIMQTNRTVSAPVDAPASGIRIDKDNYEVWVDGEKIPLGGQSYDLLCYLHEHVNQIRTRRDIIEHVFHQQYDPDSSGQYELVNTAISRLREKLEVDAKRPRHLKTVKGRGYRLES